MKFRYVMLSLASGIAVLALFGRLPLPGLGSSFAAAGIALQSTKDFESVAGDLSKRGLNAKAPAAIVGKSGVKHEFAFALLHDSGKPTIVLDTELSVKDVDEMKVLKFYVKVFDVGPEKAVLCVCPRLGSRAASLAKEYGIIVLEDDVPRRLIPMAEKVVNEFVGTGSS